MSRILLILCFSIISFTVKPNEYIITDFGVSVDSTRLNTTAIQQVIDKAHEQGGGTIVIPKGVFLTGALFFKPHTKLLLMEGAMLKGSDNIADYPLIPSRMEGKKLDYYAALINAYHVDSFSITGPGTINGNGLRFWKTFWTYRDSLKKLKQEATNLGHHRPRLLFIWGCHNVVIQNVKLCNSGFWTTHLYQCNNVIMKNCDVQSPYKPVPAPSTDGVDIDVCNNVTIQKCYFSVNDDAICIKGGKGPYARKLPENGVVENVLIEHCTFGPSHGTLTLGSESIHARNIIMRNCSVENNCPILRIKMRPDTYQTFENITIDSISGVCGNVIDLKPWKQFFDMEGSSEKPFGTVHDISMSNINVKCKQFGLIEGNPNDTINGITFKEIKANAEILPLKSRYPGITIKNVMVNGAPLVIEP